MKLFHFPTLLLLAVSVSMAQSPEQTPAPGQTPATIPGQTSEEEFKALTWDTSQRGRPLDLAGYEETFRDDFDSLDTITPEDGPGPWFAPARSPFGASKFLPPGPDGPFSVKDGILTIRAWKSEKGQWYSGCMQTVNRRGEGWVQELGYFEIRTQFPPGKGSWPAFWMLSQSGYIDQSRPRMELDIIEWYGGDAKGHHATVHLWPTDETKKSGRQVNKLGKSHYFNFKHLLTNGTLEGFHTYGCEITDEWVITYMDGREVARYKCVPEFKTPLYMLVNLAIFPREAGVAESPKEMLVDYVVAYAKKGAQPPASRRAVTYPTPTPSPAPPAAPSPAPAN